MALIPNGPRKYRLFDPDRREEIPVTTEVAAGLAQNAYLFYRPLPHPAMTVWQLMKFSLRGLRSDLIMIIGMGLATGLISLMLPIATRSCITMSYPRTIDPNFSNSPLFSSFWPCVTPCLILPAIWPYCGMLSLSGNLVSFLNVIPLYRRVKPIQDSLPEIDASKHEPAE